MDDTLLMVGLVLIGSVMFLLQFPGGLANAVKTDDGLLFLHGDITTLCISMAVLIFRVTVGPTFWKKVEVRAWFAVRIALVSLLIAYNQLFVLSVGKKRVWLVFYVIEK